MLASAGQMRRRALWVGLLPLLAPMSCKDSTPPLLTLTRVEPDRGANERAAPVRILGANFQPAVSASFDDRDESRVSADFAVQLGTHQMSSVRFVNRGELAATVPAGLPPGTYELVVDDPRGLRAALAAAYTVVGAHADGGPAHDGAGDGPATDAGAADAAGDGAVVDGPTVDGPTVDGPVVDGPVVDGPTVDAAPCPSQCTNSCAAGVCEIDCQAGCTCPPGADCSIDCSGGNSCTGEIDCRQAGSCTVQCSGQDSCQNEIACFAGNCSIQCSGNGSCKNRIICQTGLCQVDCSGTNACANTVDCSMACGCEVKGSVSVACPPTCTAGCALGDGCNSCP